MPQLIDKNLSFSINALRAYMFVDKESVIIDDAIKLSTNIISAKTEKPGDEQDICSLINRIKQLRQLIELLASIPEVFKDVVDFCVVNIDYFISQIILKQIELVVLKIKKIISVIKRAIAEWAKSILYWAVAGKGNAAMASLISPVITQYKSISALATGILAGVQEVVKNIPNSLAVPAEGMAFYMTPKSLKTTVMTVASPTGSAVYWIPEQVMNNINNIIKTADKANASLKISGITAGALALSSTIATTSNLEVKCPEISKINVASIFKQIDRTLKLLTVPQPLPKYENLSLINSRFVLWLLTGFCPAGKASFGLPG